jgi:2-polyprenyl-6-methoxyphenol hydroxylase-like FAD-dependent oxidoreductase
VAALLRSCGIDSIVLERQARSHVEQRQRAGLVEHRAVRIIPNGPVVPAVAPPGAQT